MKCNKSDYFFCVLLWASMYAENVCDCVKKEVDDPTHDWQASQP